MTGWVVTGVAPTGWSEMCAQQECLFHSQAWMELLERSFGCESIYVVNEELELGVGVSAFRAGPFKLGYMGFPVGGVIGEERLSATTLEQLKSALAGQGLTAVRIPVSAFSHAEDLDLRFAPTPETAIVDLQSWSLDKVTKNCRRDVRKSMRSDLELVAATNPADGARLFDLYRGTIARHRGSLRYTATYFEELIRLSRSEENLRIFLAKRGGQIAAFTVVARHESVAYYLHGAFDRDMRAYCPSAFSLNAATNWAKEEGCESFNLMSSPPGQDSLIRFKEHWGAETREHRTYTLPLGLAYPLFDIAQRLCQRKS